MESYLTASQIKKNPLGKKYKKTTYGGRKFFVKMSLPASDGKKVVAEFFNKHQQWNLDRNERARVLSLGVNNKSIRSTIADLNENALKKAIDPHITPAKYLELYVQYSDIDEFGYYEKNSPEYIRVKNILSSVKPGSLVYDAGCNSGGIGKILIREKKCKVYGSEISPTLAKRAQKKGTKIFCGWAEQTPFASDFFDYVIMDFILEHAIDPKKIMEESIRVLKPGGFVLGHVPTEFGDWGKHTIGKHPEHLRAYNENDLKKILKQNRLNSIIIIKEKLVGRHIADYYFFKATK